MALPMDTAPRRRSEARRATSLIPLPRAGPQRGASQTPVFGPTERGAQSRESGCPDGSCLGPLDAARAGQAETCMVSAMHRNRSLKPDEVPPASSTALNVPVDVSVSWKPPPGFVL
jgi:hypothetical protein